MKFAATENNRIGAQLSSMPPDFTPEARRALRAAEAEATREGRRQVAPAHLFLGALDCSAIPIEAPVSGESASGLPAAPHAETAPHADPAPDADETAAARAVLALDVEPHLLRLAVQTRLRAIRPPRRGSAQPQLSRAARRTMQYAAHEAVRLKSRYIGTQHLLLGVARTRRESMPWSLEFFWDLHCLGLVPAGLWRALRRRSLATHLVVPEVLDEFRLDLPSLRIAAAGQSPGYGVLKWTNEVQRAIECARKEARATGAGRVGADHLWLGLLAEPTSAAGALLDRSGVAPPLLETPLRAGLRADRETAGNKVRFTAEAKRAFAAAERVAGEARCRDIGTDHLLIALAGAAPAIRPTARESLEKLVAAEPPSRADAAVAAALGRAGLPADHLRATLSHTGHAARLRAELGARDDVAARVHVLAAVHLLLPLDVVDAIDDDTPLPASSPGSSTPQLKLLQACAREFNIAFTPADAGRIRTVGELINIICSRLGAESPPSTSQSTPQGPSADSPASGLSVEPASTRALVLLAPAIIWCGMLVLALVGGESFGFDPFGAAPYFIPLPYALLFFTCRRSPAAAQRFRTLSPLFLAGWIALILVLFVLSYVM